MSARHIGKILHQRLASKFTSSKSVIARLFTEPSSVLSRVYCAVQRAVKWLGARQNSKLVH